MTQPTTTTPQCDHRTDCRTCRCILDAGHPGDHDVHCGQPVDQPAVTTPLDDPATVTAIITEAAARSAGNALGGPTGAHRLIVQLCADAVAPVVQQLTLDLDRAGRDLVDGLAQLAEQRTRADAAEDKLALAEVHADEEAYRADEFKAERDHERERAEKAEAGIGEQARTFLEAVNKLTIEREDAWAKIGDLRGQLVQADAEHDAAIRERDEARASAERTAVLCDSALDTIAKMEGYLDKARQERDETRAELAACRPSGIRIIGGGPAGELKGWPRSTVGICGDQCATIGDSAALIVCSLPFGHGGWHQESDGGAKWSSTPASPRPILSAVDPEPHVWSLPEPQAIAQRFHETYERLAPDFGYRTREASAKPWADVPEGNRALMVATAAEVRAWLTDATAEVTP